MFFTPAFIRLFGDVLHSFFSIGSARHGKMAQMAKIKDLRGPAGRAKDPMLNYNINTNANSSWVGEVGWIFVRQDAKGRYLGNIWIRPQGYPKSYVFPDLDWNFFLRLTRPGNAPNDGPGTELWRGGKLGMYYGVLEEGVQIDEAIREVAEAYSSPVATAGDINTMRTRAGFNRLPSAITRR